MLSTLCLLLFSFQLSNAATQTNVFDVPPPPGLTKDYSDNDIYQIGDTVQLMWRMNFTGATLTLWQDNKPGDMTGGDHVIILANSNAEALHWNVSYEGLDPSINNVYYFELGGDYTFTCHYFNISGLEAKPSTSTSTTSTSVAAATSTSVALSSSSTVTVTPTSTTAFPTSSSSTSSDSLSHGAVAGIAVGVGILCIILGIAAAWCFFVRRPKPLEVGTKLHVTVGEAWETQIPNELGGTAVCEVDGRDQVKNSQPRHELE